jgi:hypothetical protein
MDQPSFAWQPFTPRGIAAFARASLGRLLLVQFITALLVATAVTWFVRNSWFPTISAAIDSLPAQGSIQAGRLNWGAASPQLLAENRFLAIAVDLAHQGQARSPAHIQVEFGAAGVWIYSLFGCLQASYPKSGAIDFNVQDVKPWWGAWAPVILAGVVVSVIAGLLAGWAALACLYFLPAWLLGLYCDRELSFCGSWRLAAAALMPGALVMTAAIVLYGLGAVDVVRFIVAWALHIILGWVCVILGTRATPKLLSSPEGKLNPFAGAAGSAKPSKGQSPNPFSPTP